jgi:hypothetical protein
VAGDEKVLKLQAEIAALRSMVESKYCKFSLFSKHVTIIVEQKYRNACDGCT